VVSGDRVVLALVAVAIVLLVAAVAVGAGVFSPIAGFLR
jgi:hypothetical protein